MRYDEIDTSPPGYFRGIKLASLGDRWRAGAIDYLTLPVIVLIFAIGSQALWGGITAVAFLFINNVLFQTLTGMSFGKGLGGLTTFVSKTDIEGKPFLAAPSLKRNAARLGLFVVCDIATLGIGLFRPAAEPWRRCWSDSFTDTFVAAARPRQLKLQDSFTYGRVEEFPNRRKTAGEI